MTSRNFFILYMFIVLTSINLVVGAERAPSPQEIKRLPPYCAVKYSTKPRSHPDVQYWYKKIGKNFADIHHYCNALNFMTRYYKETDKNTRNINLQAARNNLDYMVRAAKPGFILLPAIHWNKGKVFMLNRKYSKALVQFEKAIGYKKDYLKAHISIIDLLIEMQDYKKAEDRIAIAKSIKSSSKAIKRREKRLKDLLK